MKTRNEIQAILSRHKVELKMKYPIKEIGIFGSVARGENDQRSDVDILVEFNKPIGLDFVTLAEYLEELLGMRVDLVSKKAIQPKLLSYIEKDLLYV